MVGLAKHLRAERCGHAVLRHHRTRHLRRTLEVVARARGHVVAEDFLRHTAAHEDRQLVEHLAHGVQYLVLLRDGQGVTERATTGDNRNLVHRVGMRKQVTHEGMAALVVGDGVLGDLVHHAALALGAGDNALHRLVHFAHRDDLLAAARSQKRALVHEVHQISARETRRELGDSLQVDVGADRLVLRVDLQDALAATHIGSVYHNLAVETAGAQKCRIQDVGAVGRRNQDDGLVRLEAVHLDEQLVERLLALVMTAAQAGAALATDGIDLVDEDDGRRRVLRLLEQVAHAGGAHTDEHLDEVGAGNAEEGHARLARNGARKQRLARARRADEQATARHLRAHGLIFRRVRQEVLDFLHLLDSLIDAGDVGELHVGAFLGVLLRLRLAEAHLRVVRLLHLVEEEEQKRADKQDGKQGAQDAEPLRRKRDLVGHFRMVLQQRSERVLAHKRRGVAALGAEHRRLDGSRAHACGNAARGSLLRGHAGVHRVEGLVERVGGIRACGDRRVIRARDLVIARGVHDLRHAILLDRLGELRGDKGVGGRRARVRHDHELLPDEKRHDEEQYDRDDGHPRIRLLGRRWFLLLRHVE